MKEVVERETNKNTQRIPYERALDFANKEKITDLLYPLFVHNIGGLLYHPTNSNRTNMVVHDSQQRRLEGSQSGRGSQGPQGPSLHHHSMSASVPSHMPQAAAPVPPQPGSNGRPGLDRAHTFPTPPASASSLIGIPNQGNTYDWNNQNMNSTVQTTQPLPIDTGLNNTRSMPTTPATTPPGNNMQAMPPYQSQPGYDNSKPYYSSAPTTQGQYASQPLAPHSLAGYGPALMKDMGPSRPPLGPAEPDHNDVKVDRYNQPNGPVANGTGEEEPAPEQEPEYVPDNGAASYANRNSYTYTANPSVASLSGDHSQLGGSPSHQNGADRMTPRTAGTNPPWTQDYNTPPRALPAGSISNIVSDTRGAAPNGDTYGPSNAYATNYSGYSSVNGSMGSTKRLRDEEDDRLPRTDAREADFEPKRRKTLTDTPVGGPVGGTFMHIQQPVSAGGVIRRR